MKKLFMVLGLLVLIGLVPAPISVAEVDVGEVGEASQSADGQKFQIIERSLSVDGDKILADLAAACALSPDVWGSKKSAEYLVKIRCNPKSDVEKAKVKELYTEIKSNFETQVSAIQTAPGTPFAVCTKKGTHTQVNSCIENVVKNAKGKSAEAIQNLGREYLAAFALQGHFETAALQAKVLSPADRLLSRTGKEMSGESVAQAPSKPSENAQVPEGGTPADRDTDKKSKNIILSQKWWAAIGQNTNAELSCPANKFLPPVKTGSYYPSVLAASDKSAEGTPITQKQLDQAYERGKPKLEKEVIARYAALLAERALSDSYLYEGSRSSDAAKVEIGKALSCLAGGDKDLRTQILNQVEISAGALPPTHSTGPGGVLTDGSRVNGEKQREARDSYVLRMMYAAQAREVLASELAKLQNELGDLDPNWNKKIFSLQEYDAQGSSTKKALAVGAEFAISSIPVLGQSYNLAAKSASTAGFKRRDGSVARCSKIMTGLRQNVNSGPESDCLKIEARALRLMNELGTLDQTYPMLAHRDPDQGASSQRLSQKINSILAKNGEDHRSKILDQLNAEDAGKPKPVMEFLSEGVESKTIQPITAKSFSESNQVVKDASGSKFMRGFKKQVQEVCENGAKNRSAFTSELMANPSFVESFYSCSRPRFGLLAGLGLVNQKAQPNDEESCADHRSSAWLACTAGAEEQNSANVKQAEMMVVGEALNAAFAFNAVGVPSLAGGGRAVLQRMAWGGAFNTALTLGMTAASQTPGEMRAAQSKILLDYQLGLATSDAYDTALIALRATPSWAELTASAVAFGALGGLLIDPASALKNQQSMLTAAKRVSPSGSEIALALGAFAEVKGTKNFAAADVAQFERIADFLTGKSREKLSAQDQTVLTRMKDVSPVVNGKLVDEFGEAVSRLDEKAPREVTPGTEKIDPLDQKITRIVAETSPVLLESLSELKDDRGDFLRLLGKMKAKKCQLRDIIAFFKQAVRACKISDPKTPKAPPNLLLPACLVAG